MKNIWMMLPAILAAMGKSLHLINLDSSRYSRTPNIPHTSHRKRVRAHAPNDGRWHMKFHRSRV